MFLFSFLKNCFQSGLPSVKPADPLLGRPIGIEPIGANGCAADSDFMNKQLDLIECKASFLKASVLYPLANLLLTDIKGIDTAAPRDAERLTRLHKFKERLADLQLNFFVHTGSPYYMNRANEPAPLEFTLEAAESLDNLPLFTLGSKTLVCFSLSRVLADKIKLKL
jgi:hypothetical protein